MLLMTETAAAVPRLARRAAEHDAVVARLLALEDVGRDQDIVDAVLGVVAAGRDEDRRRSSARSPKRLPAIVHGPPPSGSSTLVAIATYLYHREHVPLIAEYLAGGNLPDAPGNLVAWLHTRRPVYGYRLEGDWFDVGDREQLLEADNWLRRRNGLPERAEYSL